MSHIQIVVEDIANTLPKILSVAGLLTICAAVVVGNWTYGYYTLGPLIAPGYTNMALSLHVPSERWGPVDEVRVAASCKAFAGGLGFLIMSLLSVAFHAAAGGLGGPGVKNAGTLRYQSRAIVWGGVSAIIFASVFIALCRGVGKIWRSFAVPAAVRKEGLR